MPNEKKGQQQAQQPQQQQAQRDATLVRILERLSHQIQDFDARLIEIEKHQHELPASMERAGIRHDNRQADTESELEKLNSAFLRYRSDMLKLVNEQDVLDKNMTGLGKRQDTIAAAQEVIGQDVKRLTERFDTQEKAVSEHYEYAVRQGEVVFKDIDGVNRKTKELFTDTEKRFDAISKEIDGVNRNTKELFTDTEKRFDAISKEIDGVNRNAKEMFTDTEKRIIGLDEGITDVNRNAAKLHLETEKHLKDDLRELRRQIEELRKETMRRLLALDGIESALEVLLIRTEPPEKKPFFMLRIFRKIGRLFRVSIPDLLSKIKTSLHSWSLKRKEKREKRKNKGIITVADLETKADADAEIIADADAEIKTDADESKEADTDNEHDNNMEG